MATAAGDYNITTDLDWYDSTTEVIHPLGGVIPITIPRIVQTSRELEVVKTLELAEEQLKKLLDETPVTISIGEKNDQALISDALEEVQFAIRELLKVGC